MYVKYKQLKINNGGQRLHLHIHVVLSNIVPKKLKWTWTKTAAHTPILPVFFAYRNGDTMMGPRFVEF